MGFNIETAYLDVIYGDDEVERMYRENPHMKASPDEFCPTCQKKGIYHWHGQDYPCNCVAQLQLYKHYLAAGIGPTYQRLDWEDYKGPQANVDALTKYFNNHESYIIQGIGLLFTGPVGVGKTMLANLMLKQFVRSGYTCFATTFAHTIEMFTAGWRSWEDKRYFQDKFMGSEVLLLDDLGRELRSTTKLSESTFDSILRARTQHSKPTFITTNMTTDELRNGYGAGELSLISEKAIEFHIDGDDFRDQARQRTIKEVKDGEVRPIV